MLGQLKLFDLGLGVDNETICYTGALLNELLDTHYILATYFYAVI